MNISNILFRSVGRCLNHSSLKLNGICRNQSSYIKRKVKLDYAVFSPITTDLELSPIVVSHGFFSNSNEWTNVCRELNGLTGRKVIAYDAVNHGASSHHECMSYHDMALDFVTLLEKLDINKKVTCIGHRMGGKTAMTLALVQPERVEQLVVIDTAPCMKESIMGETKVSLEDLLNIELNRFETIEEVEERIKELDMVAPLHEAVIGNIVKSPEGGCVWNINIHSLVKNYNELISFPSFNEDVSFKGPTLFLAGNNTNLLCEHDHASIMKRFPSARLHHVDNTDIHRHLSEDTSNILSEFLCK